jgi:DNA-binding protein HU-beta
MNKGTFEKSLIDNLKLDKKAAHTAAGVVIDSIIDGIKNEPKVTLIGFGTLDKILRQARKGRNPKTGEELQIEEKIAIRFKPGKELKEKINGKKVTINVDAEAESQTEEEALEAELESELDSELEEA